MFNLFTNPVWVAVVSFVSAIFLTYAVRAAARRYGFVAKPKADRWHKRPTAMLGGAAIFLTTVIIYFAFVPATRDSLVVLGASSFLFFVGLVDDIFNVRPY